MKATKSICLPFVFLLIFQGFIFGQERTIEQMEQDFEQYRQERIRDFEAFREARERELREMEQAYQDYYNELHGLRTFYEAQNDTMNANIVGELIEFEEDISRVTGRPLNVTVEVQADAQELQSPTREPVPIYYPEVDTRRDEDMKKRPDPLAYVPEETTFVPLPEEGSTVPVVLPVPEDRSRITSPFGQRRHPVLNTQRMHNGVDFGTGMDAKVFAAADGIVKLAQYSRSFGNWIILQHENGYTSVYAHLNSFNVSVGDRVISGEIIAYTGNTGRSTGPHLHYEVRLNGTPVNPAGYFTEVVE